MNLNNGMIVPKSEYLVHIIETELPVGELQDKYCLIDDKIIPNEDYGNKYYCLLKLS